MWRLLYRCSESYPASPSIQIAAFLGDTAAVARFLDAGVDVNALDDDGKTALYYAAREGKPETARLLLLRGARSSLQIAAGLGDIRAVKQRVGRGEDVSSIEKYGGAPLHWAAKNGHAAVVEYLLRHKAVVDPRDAYYSGATPLHLAAQNGHMDVVRLLVRAGADVGGSDEDRRTPLHLAASWCRAAVIRYLVEHGADANAKDASGETPLHRAVSGVAYPDAARREAVMSLLEGGADPNARCSYGYSPLYQALRDGQFRVARDMISRGGEVDLFVASGMGYARWVRRLLEPGVDVNAKDGLGYTALHWAARAGRKDVVILLLSKGAGSNANNKARITPLHLALWGAEDDLRRGPISRLMQASRRERYLEVAKLLVLAGADVGARDTRNGVTPLEFAVDRDFDELVDLMREQQSKK